MGRYQGAYILDPERSVIGIWYSKLDWGVFNFPGENVIIAYPPSLKPGSDVHSLPPAGRLKKRAAPGRERLFLVEALF